MKLMFFDVFWRAGRWKTGDKKTGKNVLKHIFFGGLVAGRSAAKILKKYLFF